MQRLAVMLNYPTIAQPSRRAIALALPLTLLIAACGAAAAPTPSPAGPTARPTPTAVPGDVATINPGDPGNSGGGTDPGNPGTGGIVFPLPQDPGGDPYLADATVVAPQKDAANPQPVNVGLVRAMVDDAGHVIVEARWWSGVEDCHPLQAVNVDVDNDAKTIRLTVLEGVVPDMMCIEIAVLKATAVDVGPLAAGTWTISAEGEAKPIELKVS